MPPPTMPRAADASKRVAVFTAAQGDNSQPLADATDEEHRLLAADAMFARHPGERGVNLGKAVSAAASGGFVEPDKQIDAGLMVNVVAVKDRHQYGRVEKGLHSRVARLLKSRSSRIC